MDQKINNVFCEEFDMREVVKKKYQIFISSTYEDLQEERAGVIQAIWEIGHMPYSMEFFPATNKGQWDYIKEMIDESDYYILLVAGKYGSLHAQTRLSYTEMEFRYAIEKGVPVIAFLIDEKIELLSSKIELDIDKNKKLNAFKADLKGSRVCKFYTNKDDLKAKVISSLQALINDNPRIGWIRCDSAVTETTSSKEHISADNAFLDEAPVTKLSEERFFSSKEDFETVLSQCYIYLGEYFQRIILLDAIKSKQIKSSFVLDPRNEVINDAWCSAYKAIHLCNIIAAHCEKNNSLSDIENYSATVKTLRCLVYIDLIQHWGDIPYLISEVNSEEAISICRTPKEKVYNLLLEDLQYSSRILNESEGEFKPILVSSALCDNLMAIIYLECNQFAKAESIIKQMKNASLDSVCPDKSVYNDLNNKDIIFALSLSPESSAYYKPFDQVKKGRLHPLFRYTGILLNYAEALYHNGKSLEGYSILSMLRKKFGLEKEECEMTDFHLDIACVWERTIGYDYGYFALLKRLGLAKDLLDITDTQLLLPLPERELALNPNLSQNPGY